MEGIKDKINSAKELGNIPKDTAYVTKTYPYARSKKERGLGARTRKIVYCAVLTALIAALSQVAFPLPTGIPVTLQTFAVALAGYFGGLWGVAAVLIYLLLGLCGVPVFANFKGGIGAIAGLTGGFLVGFIPFVLTCCVKFKAKTPLLNGIFGVAAGCVGLVICHLFGTWWFSFQSGNGFLHSLLIVSVPYLLKDVVSIIFGYLLAEVLKSRLKKTNSQV